MFYSQFILAKKGPLGTIWIAAHLERKLRKNQVADTDIGVSVDSILFPEVPIALRLSSHLLLGVVRIYSRKVNYLFDDCSEALLKIKQAFRSTAVDLPPEESTAPYHSITLPETFDLDDFELPDNDIYQSNYVDHHVSTREQITLQDTMEGVIYSTSQFGLDERFGDGDTSQIGLDLDEDLFTDKVSTLGKDQISNGNPQASVHSEIFQQKDVNNEGIIEALDDIRMNGTRDEVVGLATTAEVIEYAQGPSTPGLVEEPNLPVAQGALVSNDNLEGEFHNSTDLRAMEIMENAASSKSGWEKVESLHNNLKHDTVLSTCGEDNGRLFVGAETKTNQQEHLTSSAELEDVRAADPRSTSLLLKANQQSFMPSMSESLDGISSALPNKAEDIHDGVVINNELIIAPVDRNDMECVASAGVRGNEAVASPSCSHVTSDLEDPRQKYFSNLSGPQVQELQGHFGDAQTSPKPEILNDMEFGNGEGESCTPAKLTSNAICQLGSPGKSEVVNADTRASQEPKKAESLSSVAYEGEKCLDTDVTDPVFDKCPSSEPSSIEFQSDNRKLDVQVENQISSDRLLESSDLPAPEKMLSLPIVVGGEPNDLLVQSTPDKQVIAEGDGGHAGRKFGKKRSFAESTLTVQSLNSVESFGMIQSKKTSELIPDDDDLLSSILVGRRSSVLNLKPTPSAPEVASVKRPRSAPRGNTSKRKVLMDDTMVLNGDTIRQQLTNTVDMRRVRKKAPCTHHEILLIERQFLDDEVLCESIFTGMSAELILLHSETFDVNGVKVSESDPSSTFSEATKDGESYCRTIFAEEYGVGENGEHLVVQNHVEGEQADLPVLTDSHQAEVNLLSHDVNTLGRLKDTFDVKELETFQHVEMDVGRGNNEVADVANCSVVHLLETSPIAPVIGDNRPDISDKTNYVDGSLQMDVSPVLPAKTLETLPSMENKIGTVASEVAEHNIEIRTQDHTDGSEATNNLSTYLETTFMETLECNNMSSVSGVEPVKENENSKIEGAKEDETLSLISGCDDEDLTSSCTNSKEMQINSLHSVELDLDAKDTFLNHEENPVRQEAGPWSTVDAEFSAFQHPSGDNFDDVMVANNTEFLNVDDEEVFEDDDYGMPSSGGTHHLENSGWSSRTRAVAKYLQGLFDKEALHGTKNLPLDHLLAGKTRKEASRMFFETLVLKTKDYVHVEQTKSFESISIQPRAKLMKSDF